MGYKDDTATTKKIATNVFDQGDLYFRSGDLLSIDEMGWIYFKDRLGDTYRYYYQVLFRYEIELSIIIFNFARWKGENVSTNEVEATITSILKLQDATSYGVEIPGNEGKAGMVAIPSEGQENIDLRHLAQGIKNSLPSYARPLFIRLVKNVDLTGKVNRCIKTYRNKTLNHPFRYLQAQEECLSEGWV